MQELVDQSVGLRLEVGIEVVVEGDQAGDGGLEAAAVAGEPFGAEPVSPEQLRSGLDVEPDGRGPAGGGGVAGGEGAAGGLVGDVDDRGDHLFAVSFGPGVAAALDRGER